MNQVSAADHLDNALLEAITALWSQYPAMADITEQRLVAGSVEALHAAANERPEHDEQRAAVDKFYITPLSEAIARRDWHRQQLAALVETRSPSGFVRSPVHQ